jgi:hypothetical protein
LSVFDRRRYSSRSASDHFRSFITSAPNCDASRMSRCDPSLLVRVTDRALRHPSTALLDARHQNITAAADSRLTAFARSPPSHRPEPPPRVPSTARQRGHGIRASVTDVMTTSPRSSHVARSPTRNVGAW